MKGRETDMPDEETWQGFFDAACIVRKLQCACGGNGRVAEFGCGYGTFTLPVAAVTRGRVHAFDIEPDLVAAVRRKARAAGLRNLRVHLRDFLATGTGLRPASVDHAMVFNLLHVEERGPLLEEAIRILRPGGCLSVVHWRSDIATPRGPDPEIRPSPEQCRAWADEAGFGFQEAVDLSECGPWHYGLLFRKPA